MRGCDQRGRGGARDHRRAGRPDRGRPDRRRGPAHRERRDQGQLPRPGPGAGPPRARCDHCRGDDANCGDGRHPVLRHRRHRRRAPRPPGGPVGRPRRAEPDGGGGLLRRSQDHPRPPVHARAVGEPLGSGARIRLRRASLLFTAATAGAPSRRESMDRRRRPRC